MTRKRFIKLLMSHGETPKSARAIALLYNASKTPYKEAYSDYLLRTRVKKVMCVLGRVAVALGDTFRIFADNCKKLADSLRGAFND